MDKLKIIRIIGLIAIISYSASILFVWIYANYQGYTYFQGGETIWIIKYSEWMLGVIGIAVTTNYLRDELKADEGQIDV